MGNVPGASPFSRDASSHAFAQIPDIPLSRHPEMRGLRSADDRRHRNEQNRTILPMHVALQANRMPSPTWCVPESVLEDQITDVIRRLELPGDWQERIQELVCSSPDAKTIDMERHRLEEKLRRLKDAYFGLLIGKEEFLLRKAELEAKLASLDPPTINEMCLAAEDLATMRVAWEAATKEERSRILGILLEAVYCDPATKSLVAIRPKAVFVPLFTQIPGLEENAGKFYVRQYG
jgi:hypothetical protein